MSALYALALFLLGVIGAPVTQAQLVHQSFSIAGEQGPFLPAAGQDALWLVAGGSQHLLHLDAHGSVERFPLAQFPTTIRDIAVTPGVATWLVDGVDDQLLRIAHTEDDPQRFPMPAGTTPIALAADPADGVWVLGAGDRSVRRWSANGEQWRMQLPVHVEPATITAIAEDVAWIFDARGDRVLRVATTAPAVTTYRLPTEAVPLVGVAVTQDGRVWCAQAHGDQVYALSPDGTATAVPLGLPPAATHRVLSGPQDTVLLVRDHSLVQIEASGHARHWPIGDEGSVLGDAAVDADGAIWVVESTGDTVHRLTAVAQDTPASATLLWPAVIAAPPVAVAVPRQAAPGEQPIGTVPAMPIPHQAVTVPVAPQNNEAVARPVSPAPVVPIQPVAVPGQQGASPVVTVPAIPAPRAAAGIAPAVQSREGIALPSVTPAPVFPAPSVTGVDPQGTVPEESVPAIPAAHMDATDMASALPGREALALPQATPAPVIPMQPVAGVDPQGTMPENGVPTIPAAHADATDMDSALHDREALALPQATPAPVLPVQPVARAVPQDAAQGEVVPATPAAPAPAAVLVPTVQDHAGMALPPATPAPVIPVQHHAVSVQQPAGEPVAPVHTGHTGTIRSEVRQSPAPQPGETAPVPALTTATAEVPLSSPQLRLPPFSGGLQVTIPMEAVPAASTVRIRVRVSEGAPPQKRSVPGNE